jgi:3-dehydroquinate dehydratase
MSRAATAVIAGLGANGYAVAVKALGEFVDGDAGRVAGPGATPIP